MVYAGLEQRSDQEGIGNTTHPEPQGKQRWPVSTIGDILSNEKYMGNSVYGRTTGAEYPSMKRIRNNPDEVSKSENHHTQIIDEETFDLVQEMKKMRSNIEVDEHGNKVRKSNHYSMKRSEHKAEESFQDV